MSLLRPLTFADPKTYLRWYVHQRWIVVAIIAVPGLSTYSLTSGFNTETITSLVFIGLCTITGLIYLALTSHDNRSERYYHLLAYGILAADIVLSTVWIGANGGVESRVVILYVVPIMISSITLGRRGILLITAFSIISYSTMLILDYFGLYEVALRKDTSLHGNLTYVMNTIFYLGSLVSMAAFVIDAIYQILAHERNEAVSSLDELRRAQAIAHVGSWRYDVETGNANWSDEMFRIMEYHESNEAPSFEKFLSLVCDEDRPRVAKQFKSIRYRKKPLQVDFRLANHGSIKHIRAELQAEHTPGKQKATTAYGTLHDITESKLMDEVKNDFVSLASHQLRTPASSIKQYLGLLIDGYLGKIPRIQREVIEKAYHSNDRQLTIVNDLLSVVKIDSGKVTLDRVNTDLIALLQQTITDRMPRIHANRQTIVYRHRRKRLICKVDSVHLRLCLENLIDNASKYSPPGKQITVSVVAAKRNVRIAIHDKGVGIAPGDTDLIFQKFTRINNSLSHVAGGSGLGLYWVNKIIQLHGGRIDVSSKVGRGTTFTLHLPL